MELDCTMYEDVYFDHVDELNIIHCYIQHEGYKTSITFNQYGTPNSDIKSKCVIFPKSKTTWVGFQKPFEDGDVAISEAGDIHLLHTKDSSYCAYRESWGLPPKFDKTTTTSVKIVRFATEEEKQKLFNMIKDNGYRWNPETKTLEEINPKFKVGDTIKHKDSDLYCTLGEYSEGISAYRTNIGLSLTHKDLEQWELVEPMFKVGDKVKRKDINSIRIVKIVEFDGEYYSCMDGCGQYSNISVGSQHHWELVPSKFDINTLEPFAKVLVRDKIIGSWEIDFWGHYRKECTYPFFVTAGRCFGQCIPYEGNEHLRGNTGDCDDYYKIWE